MVRRPMLRHLQTTITLSRGGSRKSANGSSEPSTPRARDRSLTLQTAAGSFRRNPFPYAAEYLVPLDGVEAALRVAHLPGPPLRPLKLAIWLSRRSKSLQGLEIASLCLRGMGSYKGLRPSCSSVFCIITAPGKERRREAITVVPR
jgi:hypothetical protein